jgi:hypothetical protein
MSVLTVDSEIDELTQELEDLIIDFKERTDELRVRINRLKADSQITDSHPLETGDRVVITNTYKNLKGTIGMIIKVSATTVLIAEDDSNTQHRRLFKHVQRLPTCYLED